MYLGNMIVVLLTAIPVSALNSHYNLELFKNKEKLHFKSSTGDLIDIHFDLIDNKPTSKLYRNGFLYQKTTVNLEDNTMTSEIFDLETIEANKLSMVGEKVNDVLGFKNTTVHKPKSNERIDINNLESRNLIGINSYEDNIAIDNEPVDNTGLNPDGHGYYSLGRAGDFYYAPGLYGYLYRKYDPDTYIGETSTWTWHTGTTMSAIVAALGLLSGNLIAAIIGILVFGADLIISYNQSVKLETHTFHYEYQVRIYLETFFETFRNKTYYKIHNTTTGQTNWELKSFNYGFALSNLEMVRTGIDNYLASVNR